MDGSDTETAWWDICRSRFFISLGGFRPYRDIPLRVHLLWLIWGRSHSAFSMLLIMRWYLSSWVIVQFMVWRHQRDTSRGFITIVIHTWFFLTCRYRCRGHRSVRSLMCLLLKRMENTGTYSLAEGWAASETMCMLWCPVVWCREGLWNGNIWRMCWKRCMMRRFTVVKELLRVAGVPEVAGVVAEVAVVQM